MAGGSDSTRPQGGNLNATQLLAEFRKDRPISLDQCQIAGALDLAGIRYSHRCLFKQCHFTGPVQIRDARWLRCLRFEQCEFQKGLELQGVEIGGDVQLSGALIQGPFFGQNLAVRGGIQCHSRSGQEETRLGGALNLHSAHLSDLVAAGPT